jgi:putative addiction module component (TIGR02574 family)
MNDKVKIITEEALALPPDERERLYEALLVSLETPPQEEEAELASEIRARREAFAAGEMPARPFDEILEERLWK